MKVMIIDDSSVMRKIHKNSLLEHGIKEESFVEAEDGEKALQLSQPGDISLFLIDWNMPKMSGLDFVKTLRTIDCYKKTPLIMITSEAAKYNVMEAISAGVTNYIVKPIKGNMLWEKLAVYFEGVK